MCRFAEGTMKIQFLKMNVSLGANGELVCAAREQLMTAIKQ